MLETMRGPSEHSTSAWFPYSQQARGILEQYPNCTAAGSSLDVVRIDHLPSALPMSSRDSYLPEDDTLLHALPEDPANYCQATATDTVQQRGYVTFGQLHPDQQQTILARRLFEVTGQSHAADRRATADKRNRQALEQPLQQGSFIHATRPEALPDILRHGLRCCEAIAGNTQPEGVFPFTVSLFTARQTRPAQPCHHLTTKKLPLWAS